jgi:regulator of RNase E activity RraA
MDHRLTGEDDVVVVDMFDKIYQGTFVGGNLTTAIAARTKRGGSVIWGGVRDTEQMMAIKNV